jgi:hypothetical protein
MPPVPPQFRADKAATRPVNIQHQSESQFHQEKYKKRTQVGLITLITRLHVPSSNPSRSWSSISFMLRRMSAGVSRGALDTLVEVLGCMVVVVVVDGLQVGCGDHYQSWFIFRQLNKQSQIPIPTLISRSVYQFPFRFSFLDTSLISSHASEIFQRLRSQDCSSRPRSQGRDHRRQALHRPEGPLPFGCPLSPTIPRCLG